MSILLIERKKEVFDFFLNEQCLLVSYRNNCVEFDQKLAGKDHQICFDSTVRVFCNDKYLFFQKGWDSSIIILERDSQKRILSNSDYIFQFQIRDYLIVCGVYNFTTIRLEAGLFDLNKNQKLWLNQGYSFLEFVGDILFDKTDNIIKQINIATGDFIWQKDLSYYGTIVKLLGTISGILWLTCCSGPVSHCLLGFDVDTGALKFSGKDLIIKYAYSTELFNDTGRVLSMHGFSRFEPETEYKEIDGHTGKVIRQGVVQSLLKEQLVVKDWSKHGDKIYFTAIKEEKFPTHIGVLDYPSLELLDYQKVATTPGSYLPAGKAPVVADGKLYILDGGGTLHLFTLNQQ